MYFKSLCIEYGILICIYLVTVLETGQNDIVLVIVYCQDSASFIFERDQI